MAKDYKKIKVNFLDFLKSLSKYLMSKKRNTEQFLKLIEKYDVEKSFLLSRVISYNYNSPYIIYYINKYMNEKFDFYKYDVSDYLESVSLLMDQNNQTKLFYLKSNELKDTNYPKIKKLIREYYLITKNKFLNDTEIVYLYNLFLKNVITYDELNKMNLVINNTELKLENLDIEEESITNTDALEFYRIQVLNKEINDFCIDLKEKKANLKSCHECKLYSNSMVILDTNLKNINDKLDFMFIGLNPHTGDSLYNKPFTDNNDDIFREKLSKLNSNWMITNAIMCCAYTQKDIGKNDKEIMKICSKCNIYLKEIMNKFPSKVYILIGKYSNQLFDVKGSIVQINGKPTKDMNNRIIIPIIHPSMVLQNKNINLPLFNEAWNVIYQFDEKLKIKPTESAAQNKKNEISTEIININKTEKKLTYFDSINLDDSKILNIYIDQDGNKHYEKVDYVIPIYIKNTDFKNRPMFSDEFDYVTYVTGRSKYKLTKTLKDNLTKHKYSCVN